MLCLKMKIRIGMRAVVKILFAFRIFSLRHMNIFIHSTKKINAQKGTPRTTKKISNEQKK